MFPIIATVGTILVGSIIVAVKDKCSVCDSYWTLNSSCIYCGEYVCGDCGTDLNIGRICTHQHGDLNYALSKMHNVKLFSANYQGKTPRPQFNETICTQFYKDKDDAEHALKLIASLSGAKAVSQVVKIREKSRDGNYIYSVWSYQGVI